MSWRRILGAVVAAAAICFGLIQTTGGEEPSSRSTTDPTPSASVQTSESHQPASQAPETDSASDVDPVSGLPFVALDSLPPEAADTVALIDADGQFPYPDKDGSTFFNFEGILPDQPEGYYSEYTVPTPGLDHRGARRIVTGDTGEMYWTGDHYESFSVIARPEDSQ